MIASLYLSKFSRNLSYHLFFSKDLTINFLKILFTCRNIAGGQGSCNVREAHG